MKLTVPGPTTAAGKSARDRASYRSGHIQAGFTGPSINQARRAMRLTNVFRYQGDAEQSVFPTRQLPF
jgi:hypothetical protein